MQKERVVKTALSICIIGILLGTTIVPSVYTHPTHLSSNSNTLYVGGNGPNNYTKIQDAIDNASQGDAVYVYNGTYYENIIISKTINLIGESRATTIIDGGGAGDVVYVGSGVNVSGFTIQHSGRCWSSPPG